MGELAGGNSNDHSIAAGDGAMVSRQGARIAIETCRTTPQ
jgi:hypothetical protein